ncbi:cytochrome-c oxidase chain VIIc [Blumeria hordei DH14]|uniref:Cytochrome c oxidase subunit 8, mitochondrial n=1 Tax=Blumeria graminis f. sp. hordei (strain DH14) TaxID=546991 RepID=N1JJV2_BLUG1|nr:cytochrome-c oxidase chain VIIc [Blumeria hordei DH14]
MLPKALVRSTRLPTSLGIHSRSFNSMRTLRSSPYHYPEGPRTNIPFNPLTRFFIVRYWAFMAVGFGAPFGIAVWQTCKNT